MHNKYVFTLFAVVWLSLVQSSYAEPLKSSAYGTACTGLANYTKPTDCHSGIYYSCKNGQEYQHVCRVEGSLYDVKNQKCAWACQIDDCTLNATPEPPITRSETYVGFVLDSSGANYEELPGFQNWITGCLDGNEEHCGERPTGGWITTYFREDVGPPVVGPTLDTSAIKQAVNSYIAWSGGDCRDLAFTSLKAVIDKIPDTNTGCKIYFFSEGGPKDEIYFDSVTAAFKSKRCAFIPILTGCCYTCPPVEYTVSDEFHRYHTYYDPTYYVYAPSDEDRQVQTLFYELAEQSEGNIFVTEKEYDRDIRTNFLKEKLLMGFCPTTKLVDSAIREPESCGECWDRSVSQCYKLY